MSAYVVSEVEILDDVLAEQYRTLAAQSIQRHGGRYIARGALPETADGEWNPQRRLVIVEFPDLDALHAWYESDDYAPTRTIANTALRRRMIFANGVD